MKKNSFFFGVCIFSNMVLAAWNVRIILAYRGNIILELKTFFVVIISMSCILTYFTFKSKRLWPAVLFHAVNNMYS
ncbi:CPBP family glutamic-type intramembrane protease [Maribacter antarcticus]|uniref:CPBP family glutamic-type intramembrane protease n=1 Tax=Maribacter antarcticus TaxID=505250 RepID=UPI00373FD865